MPKPTKIIAVAGGSCSGKTTLIRNLAERLGDDLANFPFDEMFVGFAALREVEVTDWESPALYRWDELLRCLRELKDGRPVIVQGSESRDNGETVTMLRIEPRPILMVGGFLALHDERVRALYDQTIFIDVSEDEIIRRRKAQADPSIPMDSDQYITGPLIAGHRKYVEPQREFADHIVEGTLPPEVLAGEVARLLSLR